MLQCGNFRVVCDREKEQLWLAVDGKQEPSTSIGPIELFSFGSGSFLQGPEASDTTSDTSGRWLGFLVFSGKDLCVVEADKRLPSHIKSAEFIGKVHWLKLAYFPSKSSFILTLTTLQTMINLCHKITIM